MRILGLSGSLRAGSHNSTLLRAAADLLPDTAELTLFAHLRALPPYDEDADVALAPAAVEVLRAQIAAADALLIATPEYNASVPGVLKNALDWASRPFPDNVLRAKPSAVIGASTGLFGAVWAQAEIRKALRIAGADVLGDELAVGLAGDAFTAAGALRDRHVAGALAALVRRLVEHTQAPAPTPSPSHPDASKIVRRNSPRNGSTADASTLRAHPVTSTRSVPRAAEALSARLAFGHGTPMGIACRERACVDRGGSAGEGC